MKRISGLCSGSFYENHGYETTVLWERRPCDSLGQLWPALRTMQHSRDFDSFTDPSVHNDIRKRRQHQLTSTLDPTEAAAVRECFERCDQRLKDCAPGGMQ